MRVILNVLPYACIVGHIIFIFISVRACDIGMTDFYEIPYSVAHEAGEARARLSLIGISSPRCQP